MSWLNGNISSGNKKEEVMEAVTLSPAQAKAMGKHFGWDVVQKDDELKVIVNAATVSQEDLTTHFLEYWLPTSPEKQSIEQKRVVKNNSYALMDEIFGIATLTLNAYADEALGIGFIEQPIDIEISEPEIEKKVKLILQRNGIIKRSRAHMRSLCKWGDLGFRIVCPVSTDDPTDITVKVVTPDEWEALFYEKGPVAFGYKVTPKFQPLRKTYAPMEEELYPWEFVQMSVPDDESAPYGRSLLEALRTSFDQLATIEALLALSRVSKVERLVIKVPTGATSANPTQTMANINKIQSAWKNVIFNSNSGTKSHSRTPSLQDILFFPSDDGYSIDRLPAGSGVELSSTEDVEYFRDNLLMLTGLPKGYLLADESTDRYHALAAQDLKFARQLIPFQDAYANGLTKLCMVLAGYCGADLSSLKITVKIKRPIQMSDQLLQNNEAVSRAAIEMIDNWKRAYTKVDQDGNEIPPKLQGDVYAKLLAELGMQENIIKLFNSSLEDDPELPDNSPDFDYKTTVDKESTRSYLAEFQNRNSIIALSSDVYEENHQMFKFLRLNGTNVLLEYFKSDDKDTFRTNLKESIKAYSEDKEELNG